MAVFIKSTREEYKIRVTRIKMHSAFYVDLNLSTNNPLPSTFFAVSIIADLKEAGQQHLLRAESVSL